MPILIRGWCLEKRRIRSGSVRQKVVPVGKEGQVCFSPATADSAKLHRKTPGSRFGTVIAHLNKQMNISIYQAAAALSAYDRNHEVIAENMASSSVNGFKRQGVSFSTVQAGLIPAPGTGEIGANQHFLLPRTTSVTNFEPGQTKYSGAKTDVAIDGAGFFEIHLPQGSTYYTRDGEFKLDSKGQLTTKGGGLVMGQGGKPLQFDMTKVNEIIILPSGEAKQGDNIVGKLNIVQFDDQQLLTSIGNGNFLADSPNLVPIPAKDPNVRQCFIEGSNATPMKEMAALLTNIRQYETNQQVIQMHDERMGRAIATLGETGG